MTREELNEYLKNDIERYDGKKPNIKSWLIRNESYYIFHYIRHMRYVEYFRDKNKLLYLWHFFKYKKLGFKLHLTIYPATVGPGFRIYHVGGFCHIGPNCHIGKNCTIVSGVVFGNKYEKYMNELVEVGDNCYFGVGAKIIGSVRIGNNVTVGANAVITHDIPDKAIVGGIPARILRIKQ